MDNIREKLVELLKERTRCTYGGSYGDVIIEEEIDISDEEIARIADHLIANGVTVQEWIPVSERLPEKGEEVLIFDTRENWIGFAWLHPDETWTTSLGFDFPFDLEEVTHWMPIPTPPKGE